MSAIPLVLFVLTMPLTTLTSFAQDEGCERYKDQAAIECYSKEVKEFLQSWVVAWGNRDADAYMGHYIPFRSPRIDQPRDQWEADRRHRLAQAGDITVTLELDSLGVGPDGNLDVIFVQNYHSDNYSDVVKKQLFLTHDEDGLKIQREITID